MPACHVQRSIVINADAETVFDTIADFNTWSTWSPWLCIDKQAAVTVTDDPRSVGSIYKWQGDVVGQGEIEHVKLDRPTQIVEELRFIKPFKSRADVAFRVKATSGGTEVTWQMDSRLPWFMFWMKSSMETFIGMDYERGLKMLRELIETGVVLSDTEVVGVETTPAIDVLGVRSSAPTNDVGPAMSKAFCDAMSGMESAGQTVDGDVLSVYFPKCLTKGRFHFLSGFSVAAGTAAPDGLEHCQLPPGKALHIRHTGAYENLGNAWSGAHQYARYKKLKLAKTNSHEIYRNSPETTATEDLITDIYLPLR